MNLPINPDTSFPKPGANTRLRPDKTASRSQPRCRFAARW